MINKINLPIVPTQQVNKTTSESQNVSPNRTDQTVSFEDVLKDQLGRSPTVRFSAHAQQRITSRNIDFGGDEAVRLEQAVEKAANKGSRESLILMDDLALIVSIKNKVVITAVDANSRKENVFTNIDSVVLT
ncbi:MAG TPA: TIGR02530 family flagellar biosynthesis protein [Anaerolineae bacterium]|nr:flagellar protein [Anaerolineae bacterium]HRV92065.1 TIGR02530 family flagellar biosynthesis protein [Anaerolineae bacterium]